MPAQIDTEGTLIPHAAPSRSAVDFVVSCPDIDLVFQRVYNSLLTSSSGLGHGWTHSYDWTLVKLEGEKRIQLRALADPSHGNKCADYALLL